MPRGAAGGAAQLFRPYPEEGSEAPEQMVAGPRTAAHLSLSKENIGQIEAGRRRRTWRGPCRPHDVCAIRDALVHDSV